MNAWPRGADPQAAPAGLQANAAGLRTPAAATPPTLRAATLTPPPRRRLARQRLRAVAAALRWPVAWLALQLMLLLLGLMSAGWNLAALLVYPLLPRATGRRIGRTVIAWGYRVFWRIAACSGMLKLDADVLDTLRGEPGLIVVANHPSMLDAVMLVARLPKSACIMKASLVRNPLLGPGARLARYIRNDSAHGMIHRAVLDLRDGGQLVMFPEGTRTTGAPVNAFHPSFTLIAKRAQAPIQAVFIDTDSPYLRKGWPLWRLPPLPIRFAVRMGRRFEPAADHAALCGEVQAYFAAGVERSSTVSAATSVTAACRNDG